MPKFTNKKAQQAVGLSVIKKPSAQRDIEEPEGCGRAVATKGVTFCAALSVQYKSDGVL